MDFNQCSKKKRPIRKRTTPNAIKTTRMMSSLFVGDDVGVVDAVDVDVDELGDDVFVVVADEVAVEVCVEVCEDC